MKKQPSVKMIPDYHTHQERSMSPSPASYNTMSAFKKTVDKRLTHGKLAKRARILFTELAVKTNVSPGPAVHNPKFEVT